MKPVDSLHRARDELATILILGPDRKNQWQRFERALSDRLHDGYPSTVGAGYSTDVANPTLHAVIARQRLMLRWDEACGLAVDLQVGAARLASILASLNEAQPAQRCTGGEGTWADPTCEANAVTRDGLCDRCRRRRDYWRGREQE